MSERLSSFRGSRIYVDTMIPYALLRGIDLGVRLFFDRVECGEITAHASVLVFDELAYRLLLALIRGHYGQSPLNMLRKGEETMMAEFYPTLLPKLADLAAFPNLVVETVGLGDWTLAQQLMARHALRPRDAMHLATMVRIGCLDLASNDSHFDRAEKVRRFSI
jgi:predicted nucleic acid-binding protein